MLVYLILIPSLLWLYVTFIRKSPLDALPGPRRLPFVGNALQVDERSAHNTFFEWAQKYGPVFRIKMFNDDAVMISGWKELHDMCVKRGKEFAGRPQCFRYQVKTDRYFFNDSKGYIVFVRCCEHADVCLLYGPALVVKGQLPWER